MATTADSFELQRPNIATAGRAASRRSRITSRSIARSPGRSDPTLGWFAALGVAILCLLIGATTWTYQIHEGLGAAGYQPPVMWGVYIVTFVFWVGIGHAGTLISAILYLFRAGFRTSDLSRVRSDDGVRRHDGRICSRSCTSGRPWKFFWLIPYPNWRLIWPNFKSPLVWDVFAILDVPHDLDHLPLHRFDSRHRDPARPRKESDAQVDSRDAVARLAQLGSRVAALHARVSVPRRVRDAARALGALGRVVRLRDGADAGLARDDLPAVLRRRRDLLRHRHGVHDHHSAAQVRSSSSTTSR